MTKSNSPMNQILDIKEGRKSHSNSKKGHSSIVLKISQIWVRKDDLIALQGTSLVSFKSIPLYSIRISSPRKSLRASSSKQHILFHCLGSSLNISFFILGVKESLVFFFSPRLLLLSSSLSLCLGFKGRQFVLCFRASHLGGVLYVPNNKIGRSRFQDLRLRGKRMGKGDYLEMLELVHFLRAILILLIIVYFIFIFIF